MSLRVLHVLDHSLPLHSGYTFRTAAILREQRKLGWETFHLTTPKHTAPGGEEETVDGLHFFRTPAPARAWPLPGAGELALVKATRQRLEVVARQVRPDVIHAHSPVLNVMAAFPVARQLGVPVFYEVRAFWEDAAVDLGTTTEGSLRYRLTRHLETRAMRRADHVFTICEGLRHDIVERGIASEKVTVIPNAVDVDGFEPGGVADEALKASLGLSGAAVVGFIGSFYAYEGLDLLVRALPALLQRRPDVRLLLVGGGPQDAALKRLAAEVGVMNQVVFTGRVPHAEVNRYYNLVDVLAYPRHRKRVTDLVTPLKPLEAMAQGHVLVASDVGGHRELISDGQTGVLFSAGRVESLVDALDRVLANRQDWPRMRAAGRRFVESERSWVASVSRYLPAYGRLQRAA